MLDYDVVLPIKASDWKVASNTIPLINQFLCPKRIVVISSKNLIHNAGFNQSNCIFLDEDDLIAGLKFDDVQRELLEAGQSKNETGWYLQQFLKLAYCRKTEDPFYLTWDADTLPLRKMSFFENETDRPIFTLKREYHGRYFETIEMLLGVKKAIPSSFISEHMLFDTKICRELLSEIENNSRLRGVSFWEKIISATVDVDEPFCFSEFETYGTYCVHNYPNRYLMRKLKTLRPGYLYLGKHLSASKILKLSKDFDTVTFENLDKNGEYQWIARICCFFAIFMGFAKAIKLTKSVFKYLSKLKIKSFEKLYAKILEKEEFDFFFCDDPMYLPEYEKRQFRYLIPDE